MTGDMETPGIGLSAVAPYRVGEDFSRWLREVERYLSAVGVRDADRKSAILLHLIGPDIADISDTLPEEAGGGEGQDRERFTRLKEKLTAYLSPVRNTVMERAAFHNMEIQSEEDLERFLGRLRAQVARCSYPDAEIDKELRDRCVLGCRGSLQEKLIQLAASKGDKLTLSEVRQAARAHRDVQQLGARLAATRVMETSVAGGECTAVHAVRTPQTRHGSGSCFRCGADGHWRKDCPGASPRRRPGSPPRQSIPQPREAGGQGPRCFKCGERGHLRRECPQQQKQPKKQQNQPRKSHVKLVTEETGPDDEDLWRVNTIQPAAAEWAQVKVNGHQLTMLVDTGSPVTIISADTHVPGLKLQPSQLRLTSFTGQQIHLCGEGEVSVEVAGRVARLRLIVSDIGSHRPLMGREWIRALRTDAGLGTPVVCPVAAPLTLQQVLNRHQEVFKGRAGEDSSEGDTQTEARGQACLPSGQAGAIRSTGRY